ELSRAARGPIAVVAIQEAREVLRDLQHDRTLLPLNLSLLPLDLANLGHGPVMIEQPLFMRRQPFVRSHAVVSARLIVFQSSASAPSPYPIGVPTAHVWFRGRCTDRPPCPPHRPCRRTRR